MMVDGLVSIIMPSWNTERFIAETIQSVIDQTYTNWELILCDDDSKDNTFKIAQEYSLKYPDKIKVIKKHRTNIRFSSVLFFS